MAPDVGTSGRGRLSRRSAGRASAQTGWRDQKKVITWLGTACQRLTEVLARLQTETGVCISRDTLQRTARALGYSWKRMRRSLRSQRDQTLFAFFEQELALLHQAETRGEVAIYYADECRFSRLAPVPYAWQLRGQPPVELPAERGKGGYSVLGFWNAKGEGQPLTSWILPGALTGELFVAAVNDWYPTLTKPTILVLDNASIHHAALVRHYLPIWRAAGLQLQFIPAYSPELNLIEILWRNCKHAWITPPDYFSDETLYERVCYVLNRIGKEYTVTFA